MRLDIKFDDIELQKLINRVAKTVRKNPERLQKVLDASGLRIETGAKNNTIVDTGRLRSSIHMRTFASTKEHNYADSTGKSYTDTLNVQPKQLEVYVGTNVDYAYKIHSEGGVRTNARAGGNGKGFLFNAYNSEKHKLIKNLKEVVGEID